MSDSVKSVNSPPEEHVMVLDGQGWVGLVGMMGSETTVVNAARVSFGKFVSKITERDIILMK